MGGSIIGDRLGDVLIGVADRIRGTIRAALGTRPYTVSVVTRRWSGGRVGAGTPTITVLELNPPPLVESRAAFKAGKAGKVPAGDVTVTEISLTYSEADLDPPREQGMEVAWRISEGQGQKQRDRYYNLSAPPIARRGDRPEDRTDWIVQLTAQSSMTGVDGADQ